MRRVVLATAVFVAGLPLALFLYDLFRPVHATSLGVVMIRTWPLTNLMAIGAVTFMASLLVFFACRGAPAFPPRWFPMAVCAVVILLLPEALMVFEDAVYQPAKFAYLIHRIEEAATPQQEQRAFALADRLGCVWEVNRLTNRQWWPDDKRALQGGWLLELEWLESYPCSGKPYRAYRVVLDESNLDIFFNAPQAEHQTSQPGGAANGSQPIRSATNSTSSAAGSRR